MRARSSILVLVILLPVLALLWRHDRPQPLDRYDQGFYLGIAFDLRHHHRFTDGYFFAGGDDQTVRPPGMRFTPLYPALLALAATLDPGFAAGTDCLVAHHDAPSACPRDARLMRVLQFAMLWACFWMIWWQGAACAGRQRAGWIALGLSLLTAPLLLQSVDYMMTEITSLFLILLSQSLALQTLLSARRSGWALAAGVSLGLAALARPAFELLFVAAAVSVFAVALRRRAALKPASVWAIGAAVPIGAWILRNVVVMHRAALTFGYASHTFVQRLSFNSMSWREWGLSFACWMPDGNGIGAMLAGRHACDRFGWDDHPDSFYAVGIGPMLVDTLRRAGGWERHMHYLLQTYLLADPLRQIGWHLLVTLPLALRGMVVDHWWGLLLSVPCMALTIRAVPAVARDLAGRGPQRPVAMRFLLLALPGWFMLLVNAAVAVDQPRYNLMLIAPFAIAAALAIDAGRRSPPDTSRRRLRNRLFYGK